MSFKFRKCAIADVLLIESQTFVDERGMFMETFKESVFLSNGVRTRFVQDNYSHSVKGVLRGLHYQLMPQAQAKLVKVIRGTIFDVAVDIRKGSPTYGKWVGEILSDDNRKILYIPLGFAHGFCVVSDVADVIYKVSAEYAKEFDRGIMWNDPDVGIRWPIERPFISERDSSHPRVNEAENNFEYEKPTQND